MGILEQILQVLTEIRDQGRAMAVSQRAAAEPEKTPAAKPVIISDLPALRFQTAAAEHEREFEDMSFQETMDCLAEHEIFRRLCHKTGRKTREEIVIRLLGLWRKPDIFGRRSKEFPHVEKWVANERAYWEQDAGAKETALAARAFIAGVKMSEIIFGEEAFRLSSTGSSQRKPSIRMMELFVYEFGRRDERMLCEKREAIKQSFMDLLKDAEFTASFESGLDKTPFDIRFGKFREMLAKILGGGAVNGTDWPAVKTQRIRDYYAGLLETERPACSACRQRITDSHVKTMRVEFTGARAGDGVLQFEVLHAACAGVNTIQDMKESELF